ncbi:MAG: hypothetical protein NT038_02120 [Euryarchaeota archaeon]|nr:hypothetical protein [Euryarchaeota archaeon]
MFMGKEKLIPILAILILILGSGTTLYVHAAQNNTKSITVNEKTYTVDQIFFISQTRSFPSLDISGVALDDLLMKAGVTNPDQKTYTIIGADGYQKTVIWENIQNGLLTKDRQVYFSDLPKAFRIKDVITIEVR